MENNQPPIEPTSADQNAVQSIHIRRFEVSSPFPPPELIKALEELCPGSAKKIIDLSISEVKLASELERKLIDSEILLSTSQQQKEYNLASWGLVAAFALSSISLIGAVILIAMGNIVTGTLIASPALLGIINNLLRNAHSFGNSTTSNPRQNASTTSPKDDVTGTPVDGPTSTA